MEGRLHLRDGAIIAMSFIIAYIFAQTDLVESVLAASRGFGWLESLAAGMFFTSAFTTAPSIIALGEIAQVNPIFQTAFFGALGAVAGDLLIFRFVRDRLSVRVNDFMRRSRSLRGLGRQSAKQSFRWIAFFLGGLIIASPLPDELGITLLGLSKTRTAFFIPVAFVFNFLGILAIAAVARSVA